MRKIAVADCETDQFVHGRVPQPFIWGFYDGEEFHHFPTTDDFLDFIENKRIIIYAHNGGKFDWHFCLDRLADFDEITIINGRISKLRVGDCELRDSYNIIPVPLSAYQKDEIDYEKFEANERENHIDEIIAYLRSDCVYLYELVSRFISDNGLCLTLAGAAFKNWKRQTDPENVPRTNNTYYDDMARWYFGGRVECFENGIFTGDITIADINSAYPSAMCSPHPFSDIYLDNWGSDITEPTGPDFFEVECISNGALPYRDKSLVFPADRIRRVYYATGWELTAATDLGLLDDVEIHSQRIFSKVGHFKEYVDYYFSLKNRAKQEGDEAGYLLAKLFLNSLYGKFAANPDKYANHIVLGPQFVTAANSVDNYDFAGTLGPWALMRTDLEEHEKYYYNVATAASITGLVRSTLLRAIHSTSRPLYCDTDSVIYQGPGELDFSPALGDWSIEMQCDYGAIAGKKLYAFRENNKDDWKSASKGVKLSPQSIVEIAKGGQIVWDNPAPTFSVYGPPKFISRLVGQTTG